MSVSGVCQICESAEAEYSCNECGAFVCGKHYEREMGICVQCAERAAGDVNEAPSEPDVDGPGEDDVSGTDHRL